MDKRAESTSGYVRKYQSESNSKLNKSDSWIKITIPSGLKQLCELFILIRAWGQLGRGLLRKYQG